MPIWPSPNGIKSMRKLFFLCGILTIGPGLMLAETINDDSIVIKKVDQIQNPDSPAASGGNIYFEHDKYLVVPTEHIKIEEMAKAIKKLGTKVKMVVLEGYSSKVGDNKRNLDLGNLRAFEVKKAFIGEGLDKNLLEVKPVGTNYQIEFENINKNRRVQIRLYLNH